MKINNNITFKSNIIIFLIIFIFLQLNLIDGLKVLNSTITNKEANILGLVLYYASITLELDSDIFRHDHLACPNYLCNNNKFNKTSGVDCSCDYTNVLDCPKVIGRDSSCPVCPKKDEYNNDLCLNNGIANDNQWTTITKDTPYLFENLQKTLYLRYKGDPTICEGLMIQTYPIKGFFSLTQGSTPMVNQQRSLIKETRPQIYGVFNICPSDKEMETTPPFYKSYAQGDTYYFTITPMQSKLGTNVSLSFTLTSKSVPIPQTPQPTCTQLLSTHRCINDGESVIDYIEKAGEKYYTYQVEKSATYTIRLPELGQWTYISASTISQFPSLNGVGNNASQYNSYDEGENYITVYLKESTTLYLTVKIGFQTNFTFSITSQSFYLPVNTTSLPPKAGAYSLVKSVQLYQPYGNRVQVCDTWDYCNYFSVGFPYTDNNPLNPTPSILYQVPSFYIPPYSDIEFTDDFLPNPVKSKILQLSVLYEYQLGSNPRKSLQNYYAILNSTVQFMSSFFDKDGVVLDNTANLTLIELPCNYTKFKVIYDAMGVSEQLLYNVSDLYQMTTYEFMLDSLTLRDDYVGCRHTATDLLKVDSTPTNLSSIICLYGVDDKEYATDPCCIPSQQYFSCCNPKYFSIPDYKAIGIDTEKVSQKCTASPTCTESVLNQFLASYNSQDTCNIENSHYDDMKIQVIDTLRSCHRLTDEIPLCNSNSDCFDFAGENGVCDFYSHQCTPNYQYSDLKYLRCVFSQLDQVYSFKLLGKPFILNDTIIQEIYNDYQKQDCITQGTFLSQRLSFKWDSYDAQTENPNTFYPITFGLDDSRPIVHDLMYDVLFSNFKTYPSWSTFDFCGAYSLCPWVYQYYYYGFANSTVYSTDTKNMMDACNSLTGFCGYCSGVVDDKLSTFCNTFGFDKNNCESNDYCMLGNNGVHSIGVNMSLDQCDHNDTIGTCSVYCGYSCDFSYVGYNEVCLLLNVTSDTACNSMGGSIIWDPSLSVCKDSSAVNESLCSFTWLDCKSKAFDECSGPLNSPKYVSSYCNLKPKICANKQECESAGTCSDSYYFSPSNSMSYPLNLGKCVRGHNDYRSVTSCEYNLHGYVENDSPMGCYSNKPLVLTKKDCEAMGSEYSWWSPSINKEQCEMKMGCKTIVKSFTNMLPFNSIFNEMNQNDCIGCYDSKNVWTNKFNWTPGKWTSGKLVRGKWITPTNKDGTFWTPINKLTTTLDYQKLYDNLMLAVNSQMADQVRSAYFCRNQRTKDNIESIACSCGIDNDNENQSSCFKDAALLLGQTKPCSGKQEQFNFEYGYINISQTSVQVGCGNMLVSQFSREIFISTEGQSFPSGFVSYPVPDNYGLFNNNSAIVGTILGDGITIESQEINNITICFEYHSNTNSDRYPILDFGSQDQETLILHPLGLEVFVSSNGNYLCSVIDKVRRTENYFPINRMGGDWRKVEKTYFPRNTIGLLYTLGAIFLAVSIYGFYQLVIIAIIRQKKIINRFELVHLLILMIFIFILIRTIYFFLLPTGNLSKSAVTDYILVVVPTFFYFSCFTIIVVLWYVVVVLVLKNNSAKNLTNRLFGMVALVNFIIYLLLIVIILVFQYTKDTPNESCGNRIVFNVKTSSSQKAVSILYAVVQAVISLVIGAAFIYLGGSLYMSMRKVTKGATAGAGISADNIKKANSRQLKIFLLTTICSAGFILHCIFIIILVGLNKPSIIFSFIGLIITEIIPSITILYCYDQRTSLNLNRDLSTKSSNGTSKSVDTKLTTLTYDNTISQNLSTE